MEKLKGEDFRGEAVDLFERSLSSFFDLPSVCSSAVSRGAPGEDFEVSSSDSSVLSDLELTNAVETFG